MRIDRDTLEPRFRVLGCELWSDDPAFAGVTRKTGVTGICGSGIIEALAEMYLAGIITRDGVVDGTLAEPHPSAQHAPAHFPAASFRPLASARHPPVALPLRDGPILPAALPAPALPTRARAY